MADENDSGSEKEFEPSPRQLEKAHERGDFPKSQEFGAVGTLLIAAIMFGPGAKYTCMPILELTQKLLSYEALSSFSNGSSILPDIVAGFAKSLLPLLASLVIVNVLLQLFQMNFTLPSGEESGIKFDPSRLDIIKNAKETFGTRAIFGSIKNTAKLLLVVAVLFHSTKELFDAQQGFLLQPPGQLVGILAEKMGLVIFRLALIVVVIAAVDYLFERFRYMKKLRMTKQDLKDELKQSEGDPVFKAARKRRAREIANNRSIKAVPEATVLITNPTHFAIALRYARGRDFAPIVLGKGMDRIALKMREKAKEHGVPIIENKPLARALYAMAKVGKPIPIDFYKQVAEILARLLAPQQPTRRPPPRSGQPVRHKIRIGAK